MCLLYKTTTTGEGTSFLLPSFCFHCTVVASAVRISLLSFLPNCDNDRSINCHFLPLFQLTRVKFQLWDYRLSPFRFFIHHLSLEVFYISFHSATAKEFSSQ